MNRRGFITGLVSLVAAPAVVRCASLMPVRDVSMRHIVEYSPSGALLRLDIMYGTLQLGDVVTFEGVRHMYDWLVILPLRQFQITDIRHSPVTPLGLVPAST